MKRNIFKVFLNKFFEYPLWIKMAIYHEMSKDIKANLCDNLISNNPKKIFALNVPVLTYSGRVELLNKSFKFDNNIYNFLKFVSNGYNLLEISLNMFLSMEEVSKLYLFCLEQKFIEEPEEKEITALAGYIAGKFLTGEYFLNNGSISKEQLNAAMTEQQNCNSIGNNKKIGQILVENKAITGEALTIALSVKSEARNRFVVDPEIIPYSKSATSDMDILKKQVSDLKNENDLLKKTMVKIIETENSHDF